MVTVDVKNVRFIQTGRVFVSLGHVSEKFTPFLIIGVKWGFAVLGIEEVEFHAIKTSKMEVNKPNWGLVIGFIVIPIAVFFGLRVSIIMDVKERE